MNKTNYYNAISVFSPADAPSGRWPEGLAAIFPAATRRIHPQVRLDLQHNETRSWSKRIYFCLIKLILPCASSDTAFKFIESIALIVTRTRKNARQMASRCNLNYYQSISIDLQRMSEKEIYSKKFHINNYMSFDRRYLKRLQKVSHETITISYTQGLSQRWRWKRELPPKRRHN